MPSELAQRAASAKQETGETETARDLVLRHHKEFELAIGDELKTDRFIRGVLTQLTASPDLQRSTAQSLMAAILFAAQLNLEIGVGMNQFHLTPRTVSVQVGRDERGKPQYEKQQVCVPIIGYQGFVTLGYRHPATQDFQLVRIHENDEFDRFYTTERGFVTEWRPAPIKERGEYAGSLIRSRIAERGVVETYLHRDDIEARRPEYTKQQPGNDWTPNTPWKTNYAAMGDKTVMREHGKYIPKSIEMERAIALENRVLTVQEGQVEAARPDAEEYADGLGTEESA